MAVTVSKAWWQSQTMWGVAIGVAGGALAFFTKNPAIEEAVEAEKGNIISIVTGVIGIIGAIVAIFGRIKATKPIT